MFDVRKRYLLAGAMTLAVAASGCGGNGGGNGDSVPFSAKVAKGAVSGASCKVTGWSGSPVYGSGTTAADGTFSTDLDFGDGVPENAAILISCTGGAYFNEAAADKLSVPTTATISAVLSSATIAAGANTAVTPITTIAVQLLKAKNVTPNGGGAESANDAVAKVFGLDDITLPPVTVTTASPTFGASPADQYALLLGSISFAAKNKPTAAAAVVAKAGDPGGTDPFTYTSDVGEELAAGNPDAVDVFQSEVADAVTEYSDAVGEAGGTVPPTLEEDTASGVEDGATDAPVVPVTGGT